MPSRPDGQFDHEIRYEHTSTSTITRDFSTGADAPSRSSEMTLDASGRVLRVTQGEGSATTGLESIEYMLNDDGTVARRDLAGTDLDFGSFTRLDLYRYEAGRLVEHSTTDSRFSGTSTTTLTYDAQPDRLVLTRSDLNAVGSRYTYRYDAEGRLTRTELAEALDGPTDVVTDFAYDGGAVTATQTRSSTSSPRTYSYSRACAFQPTAPNMPTSGMRPGEGWRPSQVPFALSPVE
jgi:YD repeat-containing protein